jgi:hypothetical protein
VDTYLSYLLVPESLLGLAYLWPSVPLVEENVKSAAVPYFESWTWSAMVIFPFALVLFMGCANRIPLPQCWRDCFVTRRNLVYECLEASLTITGATCPMNASRLCCYITGCGIGHSWSTIDHPAAPASIHPAGRPASATRALATPWMPWITSQASGTNMAARCRLASPWKIGTPGM